MSIVYSDPFGDDVNDISRINIISDSAFSDNLGDGLRTSSSYLTLTNCTFSNNGRSGFTYDPHLTTSAAFSVRKSVRDEAILDITANMPSIIQVRI